MSMIIYLSGINCNTNPLVLDGVKHNLMDLGCTVIVPESKALGKLVWTENLELRLNLLKTSCTIYMLPDWKDSLMARIELTAAMNDKMPLCFSPEDIKELITTLDG